MFMQESLFTQIEASGAWKLLPEGVSHAVEIVDAKGDADAEALALALEEEPALAARIVRQANTAFYAPPERVTCVRDAVVWLGFEAIRNFMAGYMTEYLLPPAENRTRFNLREYWSHAIATALAADALGQKAGHNDRFRLFTFGLIHDIGVIVLAACLPGALDEIVDKISAGVPQLVAEKAVLGGCTHADVGAWLCGQWNLAEDVRCAIEFHHELSMAPTVDDGLRLLYLGNILGTRVYEDHMKIHLGRSPVDGRILETLQLTPADLREVDAGLEDALADYWKNNIVDVVD